MTKLEALMREHIAAHGPMPFAHYMEWCMRHPTYGYYMTRDPLGQDGDFTTGPEISQMFGEMIALWCVDAWMKMNAPAAFTLLECGPGRGTLMSDVLRTVKVAHGFLEGANIILNEKSPALRAKQATLLKDFNCTWVEDIAHLPAQPTIMFCNELFDTFAIRRFEKTRQGWAEQAVTVHDGKLAFTLLPIAQEEQALFKDDIYRAAPIGQIAEISPDCAAWMEAFAPHIATHGGAMLIIDYGYDGPQALDTVQAIRAKKFGPILEDPGEADITGFVDFTVFRRIGEKLGLKATPLRLQRDFMLHCGILRRAELLKANANEAQKKMVDEALDRLISSAEMGAMFKVFSMRHAALPSLLGF